MKLLRSSQGALRPHTRHDLGCFEGVTSKHTVRLALAGCMYIYLYEKVSLLSRKIWGFPRGRINLQSCASITAVYPVNIVEKHDCLLSDKA